MEKLKVIVETRESFAGKLFDYTILALIIISIINFSLETLPNLDERTRHILYVIQVVTVILFTIEYILRIAVADKKAEYMFSPFGIIDFVAIAPFYLSLGVDLRAIRAFRLLRVFRLMKLARYSEAIQRAILALRLAGAELVLYFFVAVILLYLSAVGIYYFEGESQPETFGSVFHSLWWSLETLTTVGFGDVYPVTLGGKVFTFFVLMVGLSLVAAPAGIFASALTEARRLIEQEKQELKSRVKNNQ